MFIAMNRFQVKKGCEHDFEHVWFSRDTYLDAVPGFIEFQLLKPEREDYVPDLGFGCGSRHFIRKGRTEEQTCQ